MTDGIVGFKFSSMVPAFLAVLLVAVLIIVGFTAGATLSNGSGSSDLANSKTISVSGTVTKKIAPNLVEIVLSVETLDASAQISQSSNATVAEQVSAALKSAGVTADHIKTVAYSVNEEFEYSDALKKSVSLGYRTVNQIQATVTDLKSTGSVVDSAVKAGANRVSSVVFKLTPTSEMREKRVALQEAAGAAKLKASSIAKGIGVNVGALHSITENAYYYTPNYSMASDIMAKDASSTPIVPSDVEINASVSAEFFIQ